MLQTIADSLDYIMNASFFVALTICFLIFLGCKSKSALFLGIYFVIQLLLELVIRTSEVSSPLTIWVNHVFLELTVVKGTLYGLLLFTMVFILLHVLNLPFDAVYFVPPALVSLELIMLPLIRYKTMLYYGGYFVPVNLFFFGWAMFGLYQFKHMAEPPKNTVFRNMLVILAVFAVIITAEDTYTSWRYGFFNVFEGCNDPSLGSAYIKERSYTESVMNIIFALAAIVDGGRLLISKLSAPAAVSEDVIPLPGHTMEERSKCFADAIGLTAREQDVFPLLLKNWSTEQISETLYISPGTVKFHTHNIYQKAEVGDRLSLIRKVELFEKT